MGLVLGPWIVRLIGDLSAERRERIRTQERADVAAHLHDSVLQTLALLQKSADDPAAVSTLARRQERELRSEERRVGKECRERGSPAHEKEDREEESRQRDKVRE